MMAPLYSNKDFPFPTEKELRRSGHDVLTVPEAVKAEQAIQDEKVLAFAAEHGRAGLTFNRKHFVGLHNKFPNHVGNIVCTMDADFIGQAQRMSDASEEHARLDGKLIRVNRPA